ncbi:MAG: alpha/beta hydrolase [Hyphomonas sp.]|uniref:alpha/beta hydrolase n=1 Tax=Hyphomonas sp. TaxID=87 RepID=UPI003529B32C
MSLDQTIRQFMERFQMPEVKPLDWKGSAERLRYQFYVASRAIEKDAPEMADVSHIMVAGGAGQRKARLYTPLGAGIAPGPGILFFHGGGFVIGDLDSHDMLCRRLAEGARCRVLSVDYRLAPEHKFPAAHDDALAVWRWVQENAAKVGMDAERLAVSGDSAGGNLSAYLAQEMNRTGGPAPAFQLLLYPLVQFADIRTKKMPVQESGFFISANLFEFFRDSYIGEEAERMDLRVSPLFSPPEAFRGLPPAHFVLCGWDPLHDEGLAYADKMASFGVPVTVREYPGMVHGFMNLTALSEAIRTAIRDAGQVTGRALGSI